MEGADGPMSEYSSRDIPSGFLCVFLAGAILEEEA